MDGMFGGFLSLKNRQLLGQDIPLGLTKIGLIYGILIFGIDVLFPLVG